MPQVKLAAKIARRLEDRILAEGWSVGHQIGRESEIASEMGVSRWTFREAVRILEASGFVATRKGAGGGLFVASSAHEFICKLLGNYFEFLQVAADEFADVLYALSRFALLQAFDGFSEDERRMIRERLASFEGAPLAAGLSEAGDLYESLIHRSGNPALALFLGVLIRLTSDASIYSSLDDKTWTAALHSAVGAISQMAAAVAAQDLARVDAASRRYVLICRQLVDASLLHQRKPIPLDVTQRAYDVFPPSRPMKKADRVEREIRQMIFDHGCKIGSNLGSEVELAQRFGVGRSVLREALRSLEQLGVIEMGVGSSSGLRIVSPDPTAIVQPARRHLRREGVDDHHRRQVRDLLENLRAKEGPPPHIRSLFQQILAT